RHPDVDKISFTGSTEVGRQVMKMAAETNKRVTMELGGKSPNIIFADADLKAAVRGAQTGIFYGKGEVCAAGSRLLVEQSVHQQVVEQLADGAKKLTPGDPLDKQTRLGALVSRKQQETVLSYIKKGVDEGAQLVAGGKAAKPWMGTWKRGRCGWDCDRRVHLGRAADARRQARRVARECATG